ncbi:hypothetical protein Slin15195_G038750 [Septoria linicola]|uniref:Uncharacterized protein n=1 Tax=Septoria linicola TaxID=215465 RepID=A0A9Q9AR65_9PEZI|nr:hypothetical protein Slin15195_G038750 [Septoria linicola]
MSRPKNKDDLAASSPAPLPLAVTLPPLLALPVELRLDIYDLVFKPTIFYFTKPLDHPLLHVNKRIRDECLPFFLKTLATYDTELLATVDEALEKAEKVKQKIAAPVTTPMSCTGMALEREVKQVKERAEKERKRVEECKKKWERE